MICPSGLLRGSDIFSTINATMRLTATSSGAETSRTLLPETSNTRTAIIAMPAVSSRLRRRRRERLPAAIDQHRHDLRVLALGGAVGDFVDVAPDLDGDVGMVAQHGVDLVVRETMHAAETGRLAVDDADLVDFEIAADEGRVGGDAQFHGLLLLPHHPDDHQHD